MTFVWIAGSVVVLALCALMVACDEIAPIKPAWLQDPIGPFGD